MLKAMSACGPYGPRGFESLSRRQILEEKLREAVEQADITHRLIIPSHSNHLPDDSPRCTEFENNTTSVHAKRFASDVGRIGLDKPSILYLGEST